MTRLIPGRRDAGPAGPSRFPRPRSGAMTGGGPPSFHATTVACVRHRGRLAVADAESSFIVSGTGDVIEPDDGLIGIGSGGPYALAAARALRAHSTLEAAEIAEQALRIAAGICVYTNDHITVEALP